MLGYFNDCRSMIRDIGRQSPRIGAWGKALNIPQFVGGVIFIYTPEGALVLIANTIAVAIAAQIHKRAPFSRLTSICHVIWLPLLPYLLWSLAGASLSLFSVWLAYVCLTMAISLALDAYNLVLYWRSSDRAFEHSGG